MGTYGVPTLAVFSVRAARAVLGEDGHPADEVAVMGEVEGVVEVGVFLKQWLIAGIDEVNLAVDVGFFDAVVVGVVYSAHTTVRATTKPVN